MDPCVEFFWRDYNFFVTFSAKNVFSFILFANQTVDILLFLILLTNVIDLSLARLEMNYLIHKQLVSLHLNFVPLYTYYPYFKYLYNKKLLQNKINIQSEKLASSSFSILNSIKSGKLKKINNFLSHFLFFFVFLFPYSTFILLGDFL